MKAAFLESIKLMWPDGPGDPHQWRDIIRIYAMGWCGALISVNDKVSVGFWIEEFRPISNKDWMPDESWKWW